MTHLPAAVLRDGNKCSIIIVATDVPRLPKGFDQATLRAERVSEGIDLHIVGTDVAFRVDATSEFDLRSAPQLRYMVATQKGLRMMLQRPVVSWPSLA